MAMTNDYFSLDALGYDPYHQQRADYYSRLQQLDGLLSSQQQPAQPVSQTSGAQQSSSSSTPTNQGGMTFNPLSGMGDLAAFYSQQGTGGGYSPQSIAPEPTGHTSGDRPDQDGNCPPGTIKLQREYGQVCLPCRDIGQIDDNGKCRDPRPGEQTPCPRGQEQDSTGNCVTTSTGTGNRAGTPTGTGVGYGGSGGGGGSSTVNIKGGSSLYTNENIPQDLMGVRNSLANFFMRGGLQNPAAYGGNLTMRMPEFGNQAGFYGNEGVRAADDWANMFTGGYGQIAGAGPQLRGEGALNMGFQSLFPMMQNGGLGDISSALQAIQNRGMGLIEDSNAQLREQFGSMGLGASSDVNEALARGTSRGVADIMAQQSALATQNWQAAQQNRLAATGMAPGFAQAYAQPYENALNRQAGLLGMVPGMTGAAVSPYFQNAQNLLGLAGLDMGVQEGNINRQYSDWLRTQSPQFLNEMLGFATGFPAAAQQKPVIQQQSGWGSFLGGLGGILGGIAAF